MIFLTATSIAQRVAYERCEALGNSVGYQIRLEKIAARKYGSIMFCTTGVLLRLLETSPSLNDYSHIILDEIHERSYQSDICLSLLREVLKYRKDLKVILMSATLNADDFSRYFYNCPKVHIEGMTFPVKDLYLEDIIKETQYDNFKSVVNVRRNRFFDQENDFELVVGDYVRRLRTHDYSTQYSTKTLSTLLNPETENLDVDFIQYLISYISNNQSSSGAILVILPGYTIISKLYSNLKSSQQFPSNKFEIYSLHSRLSDVDQRKIFNRPPPGIRKVIISTPLCETSITIDDVVYVINGGKMRRPWFDFDRNAKVFEDEWITKANEKQRRGRAGRVQSGICYHLYTRGRSNSFEEFEKPEILRIRLEEIILTLKSLHINNVRMFLKTLIDVPKIEVIENSLRFLQRLSALDKDENMTALGVHLSKMAIHPQIGKMLLFGTIFGCFDPISSVVAAHSFKSPFYTVMGKEKECDEAKRKFSEDSDQIAVIGAMEKWRSLHANYQKYEFCRQNFLSNPTMNMLHNLKTEFKDTMTGLNFLNDDYANENRFSQNLDVIRAVICGGLYPNVGYRIVKFRKRTQIQSVKVVGKKVLIIQGSVNCNSGVNNSFVAFHEMNKFNKEYFLLETTTKISPYALLLFGDNFEVDKGDEYGFSSVVVDDMVRLRCDRETASIVADLRKGLSNFLRLKAENPAPILNYWNSAEGNLLRAIIDLITVRVLH